MRFLLVSPYLPHAEIGHGGGIATYHFARELAKRYELRVLCFQRSGEAPRAAELRAAGAELIGVPFASDRDRGVARLALWWDRLRALGRARRRGEPLHVAKYWQAAMWEALRTQCEQFDPDVVQFEYTVLARYAEQLRRWRGPRRRPLLILNSHEAGVLPRRRQLQEAMQRGRAAERRARAELARWERHERRAVASADWIQCVTEQDRQVYLELGGEPTRLWTQPLGIDAEQLPAATPAQAERPRLLFVGSFDHRPNREAALWLLREFWPRAAELDPRLSLDIVGARPPAELLRLGDARARVLGFVPQLDPLFDGATLFVAPLFSGGGIKIKILEAMARGVCVLSSAIGVEGIEVRSQEHYWPAHDVESFLAQCRRALAEPQAALATGARARTQIRARYAWPRLVDALEQRILESQEERA